MITLHLSLESEESLLYFSFLYLFVRLIKKKKESEKGETEQGGTVYERFHPNHPILSSEQGFYHCEIYTFAILSIASEPKRTWTTAYNLAVFEASHIRVTGIFGTVLYFDIAVWSSEASIAIARVVIY